MYAICFYRIAGANREYWAGYDKAGNSQWGTTGSPVHSARYYAINPVDLEKFVMGMWVRHPSLLGTIVEIVDITDAHSKAVTFRMEAVNGNL